MGVKILNHTLDKELISKIKNSQAQKQSNLKMGRETE